jgi:hypothetical protein
MIYYFLYFNFLYSETYCYDLRVVCDYEDVTGFDTTHDYNSLWHYGHF